MNHDCTQRWPVIVWNGLALGLPLFVYLFVCLGCGGGLDGHGPHDAVELHRLPGYWGWKSLGDYDCSDTDTWL